MRLQDFLKSQDATPGYGWEVRIVAPDGTEFVHSNIPYDRGPAGRTEELKIEFEWHFDTTPEPNWGIAKLYNVRPRTLKRFPVGAPVLIKAGWKPPTRNNLLVIRGTIDQIEETWPKGSERTMDLHFSDATEIMLTKHISHTWRRHVKYSTVFQDLVTMSGLKLRKFNPYKDDEYPRGKYFFRPLKWAMEEVAMDMESKFYVYNREIYLMHKDESIPSGVTWNGEKGLADYYQPIRLPADHFPKVHWEGFEPAGWRFPALFTPRVGPDSRIKIEANDFEGNVRVVRGVDFLDGHHFLTVVDAVPLSQWST
jgi:hypothetical protein